MKSTTKQDRLKYPNFFYCQKRKRLFAIHSTDHVDKRWTAHHFISQQWIRHNPKKFKEIEHLQKIIFLPTSLAGFNNMHAEAHIKHSKFEERWGVPLKQVIYMGG